MRSSISFTRVSGFNVAGDQRVTTFSALTGANTGCWQIWQENIMSDKIVPLHGPLLLANIIILVIYLNTQKLMCKKKKGKKLPKK